MQDGNFTSNMSMNDFIAMMQQSNFYLSDLDQVLANHHISAHSGIQMRQDKEGCNLHVNIDRNSGQNGKPVTGDFHYDVLNPNPNSKPTDSLITANLHGAEALVYIGLTKAGVPGTVGDLARFEGHGIHYGATHLEAQLCLDEEVVVVGGGNSAGQAAVFLSQTARKVYMLVRSGDLAETMSRYLIQRINGNPSIELLCDTEIIRLSGEDSLAEVSWMNKKTQEVFYVHPI
jgi:hypothetical protein